MRRALRLALAVVVAGSAAVAVLFGLDRLLPPDLGRTRHTATVVLDRNGRWLDGHVSADGMWRLPVDARSVDLGAVDSAYLRLLLRTEDRRFALHPGVDPFAIARAIGQLVTRGRVVSGGSTIAMQAARLLQPHRHDLRGKVEDALRALQLEWRYGRAGVLAIYLTLAPEGRNVEGVRAASLLLFGHEPNRLSASEAAILVAVPRRPTALRPEVPGLALSGPELSRPEGAPARLARAAVSVLRRAGWAVPGGGGAPVLRPLPRSHDAAALLATFARERRQGLIRTTIDLDLQRAVADAAQGGAPPAGGEFAAIVVRRDRTVAAWLGGSGGLDGGPGFAVDMLRAERSPGSALKPFIYGLAFGDGTLAPDTLVDDRRMRLGDYAPQDFDRSFHGSVTAAEALRQSYNLPAVAVLGSVGPDRFASALRNAGVTLRLGRGAVPSLALALGGAAIDGADLATLYAGLAHGGAVAPLRLLVGEPGRGGDRLLTPAAARAVVAALLDTAPPDGTAAGTRAIAFKTGTSFGGRDAWAAGVSPDWTVVVWAGRPDGTAVPGSTGRGLAAPLMERVFDLVGPDEHDWVLPPRPGRIRRGPALERFGPDAGGPQIVFPPPGSAVESRREDGTMAPVGLEVAGGTPPYRWMINGQPLPVLPGGEPEWVPDGIGFDHVAVSDDQNRSASVTLRVR